MGDAAEQTPHPAQRDGYVSVFSLKAGDILMRDGHEYRVNEGFDTDSSACWRQSRWPQCTQLTGTYFRGAIQYVDPIGTRVKHPAQDSQKQEIA